MTTMQQITRTLLGAALIGTAAMAQAADITVLSSVAFKEAYLELLPAFERASGHKVTTHWAPTVEIMKRMRAGEAVDLVLAATTNLEALAKEGRVAAANVPFVKSGVGMAVREGAPKPDTSSGEALKRTLLAAKSVAYSTGPSGVYLESLFARMGIAAEIKAKTRIVQGEPVGAVVARGDAEIGFQQIPEILPVKGIQYLGPLPADVQYTTVFAAALGSSAKAAEAARDWVKFLTSPEAAAHYRKSGMEPG